MSLAIVPCALRMLPVRFSIRGVLVASTLLCAGCPRVGSDLADDRREALRRIARGGSFDWRPLSPEETQTLFNKAETYWARYLEHHLPHGLNASVLWSDRARTSVVQYTGLGDSALWTGHFLAALALRHAVEPGGPLRRLMMDTLERIELLTLVSGRDGYIARYAGPADDPAYAAYYRTSGDGEDPDRPGFGTRAFPGAPPYDNLVWLGESSRDTYTGVQFGLSAVWALVDDPALRDAARAVAERVGRRLAADRFFIDDGAGRVTPPSLGFFVAWARLLLSVNPEEFASLRPAYSFASMLFILGGLDLESAQTRKYYPNNLGMARMFTLCLLEDDPRLRERYINMLRCAYRDEAATHLNAHFAAIYLFCTGDNDPRAIATLQGCLLDFPAEKWSMFVDQRRRPGVEMVDSDHARYAFLPSERPMADFLWQKPPTRAHGGGNAPLEFPGLDLFLPYWMARAAGIISAP